MTYKVIVMPQAQKQLKKMDKYQAKIILGWIRKHLEGCENPRLYGKGLTENRSGEWRYRIGKYRVLSYIDDNEIKIEIFSIGHRGSIYKN